jgi:protein-tyrosine phosphatase
MSTEDAVAWVPVGAGFLALGHRPKKTAFKALREAGATAVLTLLSDREGARGLQDLAVRAGLKWIWLPLENGSPADRDTDVRTAFVAVRTMLEGGGRVFVHCSAGIHRTGMIAYALLRFVGLDAPDARAMLTTLRAVTSSGVGEERLAWGDAFVGR